MTRIVVLRENHTVTVLTEMKGIRALVVDRDIEGANPRVNLEGSSAAVDSILGGIPKVMPDRVKAIFNEVAAQRSLPRAQDPMQAEQPPEERRLVVLLKHDMAPSVLVDAVPLQVLVIDRDHKHGAERLQVEGAGASASTLYQISPERIDSIFAELAPQIDVVIGAPELELRDRVQLAYLARKWFSFERTAA